MVEILMKLHLTATGYHSCRMGSHIVTFHPTQVNTSRFNPEAGTRFTYSGGMEG